ncbi:MAG TPA: DUF2135 domain-containing protein, partial [Rhodocyclaceae bacterium]|nr:DUF2135 domain-containing protein [Rhodocyclaceae bacterium]
RVEDYARHEIDPPAELRADYERLRRTKVADMSRERGQHLDRIAALFKQEQAWWEKNFPKNGRPTAKAEAKAMPRNESDPNTFSRMPEASSASELRDDAPRSAASKSASRVQSGQATAYRLPPQSPPPMAMPASPAPAAQDKAMPAPAAASIRLKPWQPDAAYARRLRDAAQADLYRIYLDERPSYVDSTAFYLDVADIFFERAQPELGLRILSNLAEMELENRHILRVLAYRLMQAGRPVSAVELFKRVRDLAPEEPQSHRDLGLAHAAAGDRQAALHALYDVVERPWAPRFPEIESIALTELNALIATAPAGLDLKRIDPRLIRSMPLDLRVVMTWDADNSDMDLWVTDPDGEMASYSRPLTYQGGRMSRDFTGGYGPETFSLRQAKPGKYRVEANFYGHRQQLVAGATTLQVKLTTAFGSSKAKEEIVTLRLKGAGAKVFVGEFEVK